LTAACYSERIPQNVVAVVDALIGARDRLERAMIALETPLQAALGIPPMQFIHGDMRHGEIGEERHLPKIDRAQQRKGILPKWAWRLEARRLATITSELSRLQVDLGNGLPKRDNGRAMTRLGRAQGRVAMARGLLESVYLKHYPDAHDVHLVFLGTGSEGFRPVRFNEDGTIDFNTTDMAEGED
jgi:hypothetical protein